MRKPVRLIFASVAIISAESNVSSGQPSNGFYSPPEMVLNQHPQNNDDGLLSGSTHPMVRAIADRMRRETIKGSTMRPDPLFIEQRWLHPSGGL